MQRRFGLITIAILLLALAWFSATHSIDFPMYYRTAAKVLDGNYDLYPHAFDEGPLQVDPLGQFLYAPVIAFLFAPLALLPLNVAAFLFACLKIPAYVYLFSVVARRMNVATRAGTLMLASLYILAGYLVEEFRGGNVHLFSVCLLVLAFDRADRGQVVVPATALATAIALKLAPLILLPYFAIRRRFAMCATTVAMVGVLWMLPAAIVGIDKNNQLTKAFARSAARIADRPDNVSLRGLLFRVLTPMPIGDPQNPPNNIATVPASIVAGLWIVLAGTIVIVVGTVVWPEPRDEATALLEFSLVLTAMTVVAPHAQRLYFSALVLPVGVLVALLVRPSSAPYRGLMRSALIVTAAASTYLPLVFGGRRASLIYQSWSPYSIATLFMLIALLVLTRQVKLAAEPRVAV